MNGAAAISAMTSRRGFLSESLMVAGLDEVMGLAGGVEPREPVL